MRQLYQTSLYYFISYSFLLQIISFTFSISLHVQPKNERIYVYIMFYYLLFIRYTNAREAIEATRLKYTQNMPFPPFLYAVEYIVNEFINAAAYFWREIAYKCMRLHAKNISFAMYSTLYSTAYQNNGKGTYCLSFPFE